MQPDLHRTKIIFFADNCFCAGYTNCVECILIFVNCNMRAGVNNRSNDYTGKTVNFFRMVAAC